MTKYVCCPSICNGKSTKNQPTNRENQHLLQNSIKKRSLDHPFSEKVDFWLILGTPRSRKNTPKEVTIIGPKWSWELSGSHFGRFNAFFSIMPPFLVNSSSISGHPGSNFINFGSLFVVCVCVPFVWRGTLILWVVGLLCC